MHHIRNTLPEIRNKITTDLAKYTQELSQLGDDVMEAAADAELAPMNTLLKIITDFSSDFRTAVDGTGGDLSTQELSGGARISYVFHECFATGIRGVEVLDNVKDVDIRTIMYNSSVYYLWRAEERERRASTHGKSTGTGVCAIALCGHHGIRGHHQAADPQARGPLAKVRHHGL